MLFKDLRRSEVKNPVHRCDIKVAREGKKASVQVGNDLLLTYSAAANTHGLHHVLPLHNSSIGDIHHRSRRS